MCTICMKIYTSYFANLDNLKEAGIYPVAICCKVPTFFKGPNIESVAPNKSILFQFKDSPKTEADVELYKKRYYDEVLCAYRFHPEYFIDLLKSFSDSENGADIALLCYERPEDFCHRHLLAEWFNEKLGSEVITEYPNYPKKSTKQKEIKKELKSNPLF